MRPVRSDYMLQTVQGEVTNQVGLHVMINGHEHNKQIQCYAHLLCICARKQSLKLTFGPEYLRRFKETETHDGSLLKSSAYCPHQRMAQHAPGAQAHKHKKLRAHLEGLLALRVVGLRIVHRQNGSNDGVGGVIRHAHCFSRPAEGPP